MICKLCGEDKKLVKAHIIPAAFYEPHMSQLSLMFDGDELHPRRQPVGFYDKEILCSGCEKRFDVWDDYAFKLLHERASERKTVAASAGGLSAEIYESYDFEKLKLFFMSVLLRADLSEHFFWQHIELKQRRKTLAKYILKNRLPPKESFGVYLTRFSNSDTHPLFLPPDVDRVGGSVFYRFYMGRFQFHIKVDKSPAPTEVTKVMLKRGKPLYILVWPYSGSVEQTVVQRVLSNPNVQHHLQDKRS